MEISSIQCIGQMRSRLPSETVPLTFQQLWLWDTLMPRFPPGAFDMVYALRVSGVFNVEVFERSLEAVIHRHESLRTRIVMTGGVAQQKIDEARPYKLEVSEADVVEEEAAGQIDRFVRLLTQEPMNYAAGPLFKSRLLRVSDRDHLIAIAIDHMIVDGVSVRLILRDLCSAYMRLLMNAPSSIPSISVQYGDYAVWQRKTDDYWERLHGDYWRARLRGARRVSLPVDVSGAEHATVTRASTQLQLSEALCGQLQARCIREKTTTSMALLAVFVALVARWSNSNDFVVPYNSMGRQFSLITDTVGYFAHILYLRMQINEHETFSGLVRRVVREYCAACDHDDFGRLVARFPEYLRGAWFQCDPNFEREIGIKDFQKGVTMRSLPVHKETALAGDYGPEFAVNLSQGAGSVVATINYRADLFSEKSMTEFGRNFRVYCKRIAENPWSLLPVTE